VVAPEFADEGAGGVDAEVVDQLLLLALTAMKNSPHNLS
jgi:hypothetical protein